MPPSRIRLGFDDQVIVSIHRGPGFGIDQARGVGLLHDSRSVQRCLRDKGVADVNGGIDPFTRKVDGAPGDRAGLQALTVFGEPFEHKVGPPSDDRGPKAGQYRGHVLQDDGEPFPVALRERGCNVLFRKSRTLHPDPEHVALSLVHQIGLMNDVDRFCRHTFIGDGLAALFGVFSENLISRFRIHGGEGAPERFHIVVPQIGDQAAEG